MESLRKVQIAAVENEVMVFMDDIHVNDMIEGEVIKNHCSGSVTKGMFKNKLTPSLNEYYTFEGNYVYTKSILNRTFYSLNFSNILLMLKKNYIL